MPRISARTIEENLETEFHVSRIIIAYKFLLGLVEFFSGIGLIIWGGSAFRLYQMFISQELTEDPHDLLAQLTERIVPSLFAQHTSLAAYLIVLGAAKLAGAIGLIYQKNWGVDLLVGLTVVMFPFQIVSLILHPIISDLIYLVVGLLIALYLVNFKPKAWISRMWYRGKTQLEKIRG
ncbi:MAG: DUF2127 domain-containing protein [Chloroflexi bacterium]|nr:DUF2127 domain-containing protein [Chloroflexota bacterium]